MTVSLLVLGIVRRVNGTEEQFDDPEVGREINRRVSVRHLVLLVLVVGSAIDHGTNVRIRVELPKELLRHLIVPDLRKLKCQSASTVLRVSRLERVEGVADGIEDCVLRLTSWLPVGDTNHQNRLTQLTGLGPRQYDLVDNLLPQRSAHGRKTLKLNTPHKGLDLGLVAHTVLERASVIVTCARQVGVHETDGDTISVEESGGKGHTLENEPEILDTTAFLFELHRAAVVFTRSEDMIANYVDQLTDIQNDIVQSQLNNVIGDFLGNAPALDDLVDQSRSTTGDLVYDGRIRGIKRLQLLLLNAGSEELLVGCDLSRAVLNLLGSAILLLLGRILAWWRLTPSLSLKHMSAYAHGPH